MYSDKEHLSMLTVFVVLLFICCICTTWASIIQNQDLLSLEKRVTELQLKNSELQAFMDNQRNVDTAQDDRISELILSIYPEPSP